jgi:putative ABC transport system permease protein
MLQDLRYAVRMLLRTPGFTATASLTLALGIGATTLMFSIVNAVLWRPLPYPDPDRLLMIFSVNRQSNVGQIRASALDFDDWRTRARSFEALAGHIGTGFTFSGAGEPELVRGQLVTADFFRVLGVEPSVGRVLASDEFTPGRETRVVLSHRLWQRRFGGDAAIIGRPVTINNRPVVVVGVMPPGFSYPDPNYQLWAPLPSPPTPEMPPRNRSSHYLQVIGRLRADATREQAQTEMVAIADALATQYPESNGNLSARTIPAGEFTVRNVAEPLYVLLAAVLLVVLIACGNVTNLLLARATTRTAEVAVRHALGAGRFRLIRQFIVESIVLYSVGAAGALALASWGLSGIVALDPAQIPRLGAATIDGRVLAATLTMTFIAALVFGIAPAVQGASVGPAEALRAGRTFPRQRFRMAIVVAELALAVVLLVGSGLALRSLARLSGVDPGFDPDGQLTFGLVMPATRYGGDPAMIAFVERLTDELVSAPGVRDAGATTHLPMSGQNLENSFAVQGFVPAQPGDVPVAGMRGVTGDYFQALGVRLRAGRFFTSGDRRGSQPVAIVNEAFVARYWPGQDPIGRQLVEGDGGEPMRTVVGLIANIRHSGPAAEARPEVSLPYAQLDPGFMKTWGRGLYYVVSADVPANTTLTEMRARIAKLDPAMPLVEPQPISALAYAAIAEPRFRTWLLSGFAALAVTLATIGIFGVLAYFVTQRTREIGIRVALGATSNDIIRMVLRRGLTLTAIGIAVGIAIAIPMAISMQALLFDTAPVDVWTLAVVTVGLIAVATLASYVPARRALAIEPVSALKMN